MIRHSLAVLFVSCTMTGCGSNSVEPTPFTSTITATVNGGSFKVSYQDPAVSSVTYIHDTLAITAFKEITPSQQGYHFGQWIVLVMTCAAKPDTISLRKNPGVAHATYLDNSHGWGPSYVTDDNDTGRVVITKFNTRDHIVTGTFYFRARSTFSAAIVNVSDGSFDCRYSTNP